jgi:putative endonuclease
VKSHKIGKLGEEIASMFLMKQGIKIITRNYRTKFGELDIVGKEKKKIIFYEVKTISRENIFQNAKLEYKAEDNINKEKIRRIIKTANIYLKERFSHETPIFEINGITVILDTNNKRAKVNIIKNINIE